MTDYYCFTRSPKSLSIISALHVSADFLRDASLSHPKGFDGLIVSPSLRGLLFTDRPFASRSYLLRWTPLINAGGQLHSLGPYLATCEFIQTQHAGLDLTLLGLRGAGMCNITISRSGFLRLSLKLRPNGHADLIPPTWCMLLTKLTQVRSY